MPSLTRRAWYESVRAHAALVELMDRELRADCGIPLAWYDVLVEVAHAPGGAIRMAELAEQVLLSRSWLTRRVTQLENAGLLERRAADDDQRGVCAALTPHGRETFRKMERSHSASIERHFSRYLSAEEAEVIAQAFALIGSSAIEALQSEGHLGGHAPARSPIGHHAVAPASVAAD